MRVPHSVFAAVIMALAAATLSGPATAADDGSVLTLQIENDWFARATNTDEHYTNGVRASWVSNLRPKIGPDWLNRLTDWPSVIASPTTEVRRRFGIAIGQSIFTPDNTKARDLEIDDRPYAAWLYLGLALHVVHGPKDDPVRQDSFQIDLGLVGPNAYGKQVQNGFHDIIGVAASEGWDNQLRNEPAADLVFERRWRFDKTLVSSAPSLEVDLIPHAATSLGNVLTYFGGGATVRIGQDLQNDFGPPRIRPSIPGSEGFTSAGHLTWYFFAGAEGRAVIRNIFLDGNSFRDSHDVRKRTFVGDFQGGITFIWDWIRISYTHVVRTPEFDPQADFDQFGALSVSFKW